MKGDDSGGTLATCDIYQLYRGRNAKTLNNKNVKVFLDLFRMDLCVARFDKEAHIRIPWTSIAGFDYLIDDAEDLQILIKSFRENKSPRVVYRLKHHADFYTLINCLERFLLLFSNPSSLEAIQKNLHRHMWENYQHNIGNLAALKDDEYFGNNRTAVENRAILEWNLNRKWGIEYLKEKGVVLFMKEKVPEANDENIGRWMTRMSVLGRGSLDPSKLGDFFSQHWTESILHYFTKSLNLEDMTVVEGL